MSTIRFDVARTAHARPVPPPSMVECAVHMDIRDVELLSQYGTSVPGPDGTNRFIAVVGLMRITWPASGAEVYRCRVGPRFEPHEVLGVSMLPSIASLQLDGAHPAECSIATFDAEYDVDSGQVEVALDVLAKGNVRSVAIVFSVTILAAA